MRDFTDIKRVILKIGSSSLVHSDLSVNVKIMDSLLASIARLRESGIEVALVSSGAIALGMHELHLESRPKAMALKQACAAVGQAKLMEAYNRLAEKYHLICGQILLNHDDFQIKKRMLYLSDTLEAMFKSGAVPVINENDALAVEEIRVGDNDTLSSLLVPMIHANLLILFSDIDGLYDQNPRLYPQAKRLDTVSRVDAKIYAMAGINSEGLGTGGMKTKLNAAVMATNAGCDMLICHANQIENLVNIVKGEDIGTLFTAKPRGISSREHWIIFKAPIKGSIVVDNGVKEVLLKRRVSVLPAGILSVSGAFSAQDVIEVRDTSGGLICKGIAGYSSAEIQKIKGLSTQEIRERFPSFSKKEVIHANNLVIIREDYLC